MKKPVVLEQTILTEQDDYLAIEIESFLRAKKVRRLAPNTIRFYATYLHRFNEWCEKLEIKYVKQITANVLRDYLLALQDEGHNVGGIKTYYASIRSFLKWYWLENEMPGQLLFEKVPAPKNDFEVIGRLTVDKFKALLDACSDDWIGVRNKAILTVLASTGMRAGELLNIKLENLDLGKSQIFVPAGNTKTKKPRTVLFATPTRIQVRRLLKYPNKTPWLFVDRTRRKMSYGALRLMLRHLCQKAGIELVSPHDFRRFFITSSISSGMDLVSISRIVGHEDVQLLKRYARQLTIDDIQARYVDPVKKMLSC